MKHATLLIMAAGIGSRFGADIKQLTPVGPNREVLMDYTIHDALTAGFDKIIFILRRELLSDFQALIGHRMEELCGRLGVQIQYVFQTLDDIPAGAVLPPSRKKPWGTGQAVLAAKECLREPCVVVNADDHYGKEIFAKMYTWLMEPHRAQTVAMAGYALKNTLSDHGGVTRGVCTLTPNGRWLTDITETKQIQKADNGARAGNVFLSGDTVVSMNLWAFPAREDRPPAYLDALAEGFDTFFQKDVPAAPDTAEFLLPIHIGKLLQTGDWAVEVIPTGDSWSGVTYHDDLPLVQQRFQELVDQGVYGHELYADLL